LAFDKIRSKEKFIEYGVSTPESEVLYAGQRPRMEVPIVVKPSRQGSTVGIRIVKKSEELDAALGEATKFDNDLLIEKFIPGRELTIGILGIKRCQFWKLFPKAASTTSIRNIRF